MSSEAALESPREPSARAIGEHELKFLIPSRFSPVVLAWLRSICDPDPEFPSGIVSSIYFDTPGALHLEEKVNSDYLKTKVRLRWYEDVDRPGTRGPAFVEVKYRIGSTREKARVRLPARSLAADPTNLHDPALRTVPAMLRARGFSADASIVPVMLIRYRRHRFIEPASQARVSIDTEITAPSVNRLVLRPARPCRLPVAVVEVKGLVDQLPPALYALTATGARKASFSKYSACYQAAMRVVF